MVGSLDQNAANKNKDEMTHTIKTFAQTGQLGCRLWHVVFCPNKERSFERWMCLDVVLER